MKAMLISFSAMVKLSHRYSLVVCLSHAKDRVVVAVGVEPACDIAENSGLELDDKRGGILVNPELEAVSNVYSAGDVCSYFDSTIGRRRVEHFVCLSLLFS